jgi:hypothetical protein
MRVMTGTAAAATGIEVVIVTAATAATATEIATRDVMDRATRGVRDVRAARAAAIQRRVAPTPRQPSAARPDRIRRPSVTRPHARNSRSERISRNGRTNGRAVILRHGAASPVPGTRARMASAPAASAVNAAAEAGGGVAVAAGAKAGKTPLTETAATRAAARE